MQNRSPAGPWAVFALAIVLSGCFSSDGAEPLPSAPLPLTEFGFRADGAVVRNESVIVWDGTVGPNLGGAAPTGATAVLEVPPGPALIVTTTLTWADPQQDLDLVVRGPDGLPLCESAGGSAGPAGVGAAGEPVESCRAGARGDRGAESWQVEVVSFDARGVEVPFRVELRVHAPAIPAVDAAVQARFGAPILVGTGADAETSLTIAPDGTMLACTHGAFRVPSPLWASEDAGTTWEPITVGTNPVPSGDCDVAIAEDGVWYVVYNTIASATIASSADRGQTWQVQPVAAYPFTGAVDRPWILADGNDITMTYANAAATAPAVHYFTRSTDRGLTWPVHTVTGHAEGPGKVQKVPGHFISSNDGQEIIEPVMSYASALGVQLAGASLVLHRSQDAGLTWSPLHVAGPFEAPLMFPGVARTADGTLYASYARGTLENATVEVVWSLDDGATWSEPVEVARNVASRAVVAPFMDARPGGGVTLAWLQADGAPDSMPGTRLWVARVDAHAAEPLVFSGGITEPYGDFFVYEYIMVRHDAHGRAHVLYVERGEECGGGPGATRQHQCLWLVSEEP